MSNTLIVIAKLSVAYTIIIVALILLNIRRKRFIENLKKFEEEKSLIIVDYDGKQRRQKHV